MVEVGDKHIMWPCVFSQSDSVFPEETVALHIFVSQDWIQGHSEIHFSWAFGVCAYSDTVLVLSHLSCFVSWT